MGSYFGKCNFMFPWRDLAYECPDEFKPVYYKRYVDEIFVLFRLSDYLEKFKNYLNSILPEPAMVSKHLSITNPPLVDHIYISTVSLLKNIKLVGFHSIIPKVSTCFGFSKILFRSRSFKRNIIKERISYQIDW